MGGVWALALATNPAEPEKDEGALRISVRQGGEPLHQPFTKVNFAAIVRADREKRWHAYALGRQWGWLSVNDIRLLEDMEPIGPEGDAYLVPLNMAAADTPAEPADIADAQLAAVVRQVRAQA